jgi:hypothetical protein
MFKLYTSFIKLKGCQMTKINKILLAPLSIITLLNTALLAEETSSPLPSNGTFIALTWSPDTKDGTIEGQELKGNGMIGLYGGKTNFISDNLGVYGGFDMSYNTVDETETSHEVMYSYRIINVGLTYTPIKDLTLMAGIGYSIESAEFMQNGSNYQSIEDNDQVNFNAEVSYKIGDSYGVITGYNTAPEAFNIGFIMSF